MLQCLRTKPCSKILNDNSSITITHAHTTPWGPDWLDAMLKSGLEFLAWVYPLEYGAREETELALRFVTRPTIATFDDIASACIWLEKRKPFVPEQHFVDHDFMPPVVRKGPALRNKFTHRGSDQS
ncbi:hypothetical protein [Hymenobacter jejuensis]|uniref:Uncharacterized protein n=2 Tax=Hymenobacter TaxID=89966 RepID=A0A5B8A0S2_9BACT|nr:hypothetical protein [Hymenobacter jejuensis]MBC6992399.1 hypothetical protein [Hymenobacter sp. BT491]QDA60285.1 hypothetical protein FHG12_09255 [Hymenobacter jejuensis]